MNKEIISICYEINKACTLLCDYCITNDNGLDEVNSDLIIKYIAKLKPKRIVVSGGEPLLDNNLVPKLKMIKELCPDAYVSLSSNGVVNYDYKLINELVDCIDISLPSLDPKIYKQMRGKDSLQVVKSNLEKIRSSIDYVRLSFMLTKVNKYDLINVLDYAKRLGVDEFRIGRYFPFRGGRKYSEKYELTDSEINEVINDINLDDYPFKCVLPISNLKVMSDSYLTVNYLGEVSTPNINGKNIIVKIDSDTINDDIIFVSDQESIFNEVTLKKTTDKKITIKGENV